MDSKEVSLQELIPLYKINSKILIGLREDYKQGIVKDGLALEIDVDKKGSSILYGVDRKKLKFGYYEPVNASEEQEIMQKINDSFDKTIIWEMLDLLLNPSNEAIQSLIWVPERLRK